VISTHLLQELEALCTRVVALHGGRALELGAPDDAGPGIEDRYLAALRST
jgi:ABC-type multidrug transport system ATPase subunit